MKNYLGILFILLLSINSNAQQASNWKNYANMKNVQAIASTSSGLWAATSGGAFFYDQTAKNFKTLHKADGLNGINLSAVTIDSYGKVWFGSVEGIIDVYNPSDNSVKSILDIYNSNNNVKQIFELKSSGDTIFVSTSFGISLIDANSLLFYDTYFKFGGFSSNIQVNSTLKTNLIYACTVSGLAIQKQGATNLSAPESWNVYSASDGLPASNVNKVIQFNGSLIIGTTNGLSSFDGSKLQAFLPQLTGNINDLYLKNDSLFILSGESIIAYYNNSIVNTYTLPTAAVELSYSSVLGLVAASANGIIQVSNYNSFAPNGPFVNQFPSMAVDNNGVLWCASGEDVTGKGFYKFDGKTWTNYDTSTSSIIKSLKTDAFHLVYAAPDNSIYFGNWGQGFIKLPHGAVDSIDWFNSYNTKMEGFAKNPYFVVITGFATDSRNNLWVLNWGSVNLKTLILFTNDSAYYFQNPSEGFQEVDQNFNLVIDQYGTKWYSSLDPNKSGLFYFNENNTINNLNDDYSGYLTTSDGLNTNSISSVVVDQMGDLWVGTSLGVNIISNTDAITTGSSSQLSISSVFSLRQYTINCIAVDPINQKWIGTNQGLILVNSDGSEVLASYNSINSPLQSNNITSIAIDKNLGTVYVGTDQGLTSFQTSAIKPNDSFTKLFIYPNPFVLKSGSNRVTIDGLIQNSEIKILTLRGKLVKDFLSPGGRVAYWDGTNTDGNLVSSGVYLVVAFDKDGTNVFTGKIAVIHH